MSQIPKNARCFTVYEFLTDDRTRCYKTMRFTGSNPAGQFERLLVELGSRSGISTGPKSEMCAIVDIESESENMLDNIPLTEKGLDYLCQEFELEVDFEDVA